MNNCRSGLYGFASTTTWLHERGMASPPLLVTLGLMLPDSRILSGIAGIGLTLINIAIILPHLRQPILNSMHARDGELGHEQNMQEQVDLKLDEPDVSQPVDLDVESPVLVSASPCREHQSPPLACSATVKSLHSAVTEPLECLDAHFKSHEVEETDENQVPSQICRSPDAHPSKKLVGSNHLLVREYQSPLHILLPVPDVEEVAFFDTTDATFSNFDLEEHPATARDQHAVPDEHSATEVNGPIDGEVIEQAGQPVTVDLPSTPGHVEVDDDFTDVEMLATDEDVVPSPTKLAVQDHHNHAGQGNAPPLSDGLAATGGTHQSAQAEHSIVEGKEFLVKRRPESLEFIPQSVIRRYPLASMGSAGYCFGHQAFSSGHSRQIPPAPPHLLTHNPSMLLEGTRPRANYTTLEAHWCTSFFSEEYPKKPSTGAQAFFIETISALAPLQWLPEPSAAQEMTPRRKYPIHRRRLGVLARAALRDRRAARRCRKGEDDGSSASDSDSEWDSDSQSSSGSSADESMLPHMLGTDLIAAIDANSESELNLIGSKRKVLAPLDVYEDFLFSEESAADVSMIMHVSSIDEASDSGSRANASFHSLTYEDIQQWACGVVQKCVRQVCRNRPPVEPSSPSQASDVCAEKPSGSGVSQCPLAGLHCKLGATALSRKASQASLPPTSTLPNRKPLSVRNIRDIPEFVPRQRHASVVAGQGEEPQKLGTRSTVDAASAVIARMENQAGFNARQRFMGTDENRMLGGWQRTQKCA